MSGWAFFYALFGAANTAMFVASGSPISLGAAIFCLCGFLAHLVRS